MLLKTTENFDVVSRGKPLFSQHFSS